MPWRTDFAPTRMRIRYELSEMVTLHATTLRFTMMTPTSQVFFLCSVRRDQQMVRGCL
jgi:hypothetical protein